jgi:hypothetical protein
MGSLSQPSIGRPPGRPTHWPKRTKRTNRTNRTATLPKRTSRTATTQADPPDRNSSRANARPCAPVYSTDRTSPPSTRIVVPVM